jgi:hypothetical protein
VTDLNTGRLSERRLPVWLVFLSYVLLSIAWVVGNPPFGGPDEWAHYLRAVSIGDGQLVGKKPRELSESARSDVGGGPTVREAALGIVGPRPSSVDEKTYQDELAWVGQNTRVVRLPAGKTPGWSRCPQINPLVSAGCLNNSPPPTAAKAWLNPTATYQPFPYIIPAALSRIDIHPDHLDRLMRAGKASMSLALLAGGLFFLWSPEVGFVSLIGPLLAITPMTLFLAATLNPSGLEITAAIGFIGVLLRLTREGSHSSKLCWGFIGVSGAVLCLSRTQGPAWAASLLLLIVMAGDPRAFARTLLHRRRWSVAVAVALLAAVVLNRAWEYMYGPRLPFDPFPLVTSMSEGLAQLPGVLAHQVGVFNYLEVPMPRAAYLVWGALVFALLIAALLVGTWRQRLVLLISAAGSLALPIVLVATTMRHTGFGLQGRYVLGFSVIVPLLAGEILVRRYDRLLLLEAEKLFLPFAAAAGCVQLMAWWTNARRFAVGISGPRWFLAAAEWSPPLGWWPWLLAASGGALLLSFAPLVDKLLTRRTGAFNNTDRLADEYDSLAQRRVRSESL